MQIDYYVDTSMVSESERKIIYYFDICFIDCTEEVAAANDWDDDDLFNQSTWCTTADRIHHQITDTSSSHPPNPNLSSFFWCCWMDWIGGGGGL